MPVEREECCKNCGEDIPAAVPINLNFCSGFCTEEYELKGGDAELARLTNEVMEDSMDPKWFEVICVRCRKIVGHIPDLLDRAMVLPNIRRQHRNCEIKETA